MIYTCQATQARYAVRQITDKKFGHRIINSEHSTRADKKISQIYTRFDDSFG